MPGEPQKHLKLLMIANFLREQSDEKHPVSAPQICAFLAQKGISAERKSVYSDLALLRDYGMDILKTKTPRPGYFLASREFELPEVYLLRDAVLSAGFISVKKTRELTRKLEHLLSVHEAKRLRKDLYIDYSHKCRNEQIFYIIDALSEAIEKQKKVTLTYCMRCILPDRKIGIRKREHTVSPYALIWQADHYYLVANNAKYNNLMHLRLDRIKNVQITNDDRRPVSEVSDYSDRFDVADYVSKTFQMYTGTPAEITLKCDRKILEQVVDRFSEEIFIEELSETDFRFSAKAYLSEGLCSWILQYGKQITVEKPKELVELVLRRVKEIESLYSPGV